MKYTNKLVCLQLRNMKEKLLQTDLKRLAEEMRLLWEGNERNTPTQDLYKILSLFQKVKDEGNQKDVQTVFNMVGMGMEGHELAKFLMKHKEGNYSKG